MGQADVDDDEAQIRALVATWMAATQAGEVDRILELMTEDVVFLLPGHSPMGKAEFAAAARAQAGAGGPRIEGHSDIQEIQVMGAWAFMWSRLTVRVEPAGAPTLERDGHTLTILRKEAGQWRLARDANLLAPVTGR